MSDAPLVFALGLVVGMVGGWQLHGACRELMATARWTVRVLRRLYGWHRAREARRLAALETVFPDGIATWGRVDARGEPGWVEIFRREAAAMDAAHRGFTAHLPSEEAPR